MNRGPRTLENNYERMERGEEEDKVQMDREAPAFGWRYLATPSGPNTSVAPFPTSGPPVRNLRGAQGWRLRLGLVGMRGVNEEWRVVVVDRKK